MVCPIRMSQKHGKPLINFKISEKLNFPKGFLLDGAKKIVFDLKSWVCLKNFNTKAVYIQAQAYPYMIYF